MFNEETAASFTSTTLVLHSTTHGIIVKHMGGLLDEIPNGDFTVECFSYRYRCSVIYWRTDMLKAKLIARPHKLEEMVMSRLLYILI